ncbi:AAA family ATPase [Trichocoleus sp. FACHB-591]|uniref:AAA family ATPase n=1 Tax=Trichocoleus sp. FACHB-591 TaxID=2692872 RepID=UPI001686FCA0|nr:AAA family ATPase [Trichocoleus sp. FACHB-591]MBD2094460.1 AAA family ATPase [Trichocoleus sp. FACHB-591]
MAPDPRTLFRATNPSRVLDVERTEDRQYYIDFSSVQGGPVNEELKQTITFALPDHPTCQLLTGHIGTGKSTELMRLKAELEYEGFHVIYFDVSTDLEMTDVDIVDVLLAIARQVSQSLEYAQVNIQVEGLRDLLNSAMKVLLTEVNMKAKARVPGLEVEVDKRSGFLLPLAVGELAFSAKNDADLRQRLHQYLAPQKNRLLEAINKELLEPANAQLRERGKQGLVVIVDNLDRLDSGVQLFGSSPQEYLFIDQAEQLRSLNCHVIYTVPIALRFSSRYATLIEYFDQPKILPTVRVKKIDGSIDQEGIALLRQAVLVRAFPDLNEEQRLAALLQVFDSPDSLDRLCQVSGGHIRDLFRLLNDWIKKGQQLPLDGKMLESVISARRNEIVMPITDDEWELLRQVHEQKRIGLEDGYLVLIRSRLIFEYRDQNTTWFDINPILAESRQLQKEVLDRLLSNIKQFFRQANAEIDNVVTNSEWKLLEIVSATGQLASYVPMPVIFVDKPTEQTIQELVDYSKKINGSSQYKVSILLYQESPDTLALFQIAQVRVRDHFVIIPIPFAAIEQALVDESKSFGLLTQYASRYMPGADLFNDRNAIGDTLSFFGRNSLLTSLEEDLRRLQGIGLFGLRKSGKTSMLLQLGLSMRQHPVIHIDLQPYAGRLHYGAELFNQILKKLADLLRVDSATAQGFVTFASSRPAKDFTTDFMEKANELASALWKLDYHKPIFCFLDEVERILPTELDPPDEARHRIEEFNAVFGTLRALNQESKLISLLVADLHPDCNSINHWHVPGLPTNPVYKFFKEVFVAPFSQEETTQMLTDIGHLMGVEFEGILLEDIHQQSGGYPFISRQIASLLCKKAEKEMNGRGELITSSAASRYLKKPFSYSDLADYFEKNIWDDLQNRKDRNFSEASASIGILKLLSSNEELLEGIQEEVILELLSETCGESECERALRWLEAVGLVERLEFKEGDSYKAKVPLMSNWLRRDMKLEEIRQWRLG